MDFPKHNSNHQRRENHEETIEHTCRGGTIIGVAALGAANAAETRPAASIIAQDGLGDGSWSDTTNAGFQAGVKATGIKGKAIESKDVVAQSEEIIRRATDGGFGLVTSLEWIHGESMEKLAGDYPDVNWVIMNQIRKGSNVASVGRSSKWLFLPPV